MMVDPIIGAFLYTLILACMGVIGWIATRSLPKSSLIRILCVPLGMAGTVWVVVAAVVIIVRLFQLGGIS